MKKKFAKLSIYVFLFLLGFSMYFKDNSYIIDSRGLGNYDTEIRIISEREEDSIPRPTSIGNNELFL